MKDYILNEEEAASYIRDVRKNSNGTLSVEFGDGKVFSNIIECEENLQKIISAEEAQAKKGIENYATFRDEVRKSRKRTFLSGVGAFALSTGATFIPAVSSAISGQNPLFVCAGIGAITVLGMIPAYAKLKKDSSKVEELDKLRFRQKYFSALQNFRNYPNALSGINPQVANWIWRNEDPFCILNIDAYDKEDLEKIVENIGVEETYHFTYQKRSPRR